MKVCDLAAVAELITTGYYPYKWDRDLLFDITQLKLKERNRKDFPNKDIYFLAMEAYDAWLYACNKVNEDGKKHIISLLILDLLGPTAMTSIEPSLNLPTRL